MESIEIVCFDCDHAMAGDDEGEAVFVASQHANATGHHLAIQRHENGQTTSVWQVLPKVPREV